MVSHYPFNMWRLTDKEQWLVLGILTVFIAGAAVKAWREAHRPAPADLPTLSSHG